MFRSDSGQPRFQCRVYTVGQRFKLGAGGSNPEQRGEIVIPFASHLLNNALVWGIQKYKPYLEGYHFTAITDHVAFELVNVARFTQLGMLGDGTLAVRRQDKVPKGDPKPCCRHFV